MGPRCTGSWRDSGRCNELAPSLSPPLGCTIGAMGGGDSRDALRDQCIQPKLARRIWSRGLRIVRCGLCHRATSRHLRHRPDGGLVLHRFQAIGARNLDVRGSARHCLSFAGYRRTGAPWAARCQSPVALRRSPNLQRSGGGWHLLGGRVPRETQRIMTRAKVQARNLRRRTQLLPPDPNAGRTVSFITIQKVVRSAGRPTP